MPMEKYSRRRLFQQPPASSIHAWRLSGNDLGPDRSGFRRNDLQARWMPMRTAEDRAIDKIEAMETRRYAQTQRRDLGWECLDRVDPFSLENVKDIWTVRDRAAFRLRFVDDDIENRRGKTTWVGSTLVIEIPESIRRKAFFGDGYARFVILRELGHATLGHPAIKATLIDRHRDQLIEGGSDARKVLVSASGSLAFQAGVFAAALLIGGDVAPGAASPEELAVRYGIDVLSARVYFTEIQPAGSRS
jgi:hypothetical protein